MKSLRCLRDDGGHLKENEIQKILKDPNLIQDEIKRLENRTQQPQYELKSEDIQISIRPVESVPAAMFKPDPQNPQGYIANSLTIRAMRPDIFVLGDSIDDLEVLYNCVSCKQTIDKQFWKCCPYCGSAFKE